MGMPEWGIGDGPDIFCRSGRPLRHFDMLKFIPPSRENVAISEFGYILLSPAREVTKFKLHLKLGISGRVIRLHTPRLTPHLLSPHNDRLPVPTRAKKGPNLA